MIKIDNALDNREFLTASKLLEAYAQNKVIHNSGLAIAYNPMSDIVYLYNEYGECCFFNDEGELEQWITLDSQEGFLSDLIKNIDLLTDDDKEQLKYYIKQ